MPIVNRFLHEATKVVASPNGLFARQDSTTAPSPAATTDSAGDDGKGRTNSLLFFVALGFGVVFTNLWIMVGVKYCFRYNARNHQLRAAAEGGEMVSMDQPPRPRRRRVKKLMTMDEVNDKFPMIKYKSWLLQKSTSNPSTAPVADANDSEAKEASPVSHSTEDLSPNSTHQSSAPISPKDPISNSQASAEPKKEDNEVQIEKALSSPTPSSPVARREGETIPPSSIHNSDTEADDSDDDQMAAVPPNLDENNTDADTCAICIDTLEDDDDVRGLTCGHAFHAACVDPWLTVRRACCPLCKADYYIPKPRPEAPPPSEPAEPIQVIRVGSSRGIWLNLRGDRQAPANMTPEEAHAHARREQQRARRARRRAAEVAAAQRDEQALRTLERRQHQQEEAGGIVGSLRSAFTSFRLGRTRNTQSTNDSTNTAPTSAETQSQLPV
ncbi:hypothetical protein BROUX41_001238 [Berkeleyomyces rouxiae]|uniref:uncharacterized protein n=1 Tax=Berkeleyomyces rouxiae TaxID=2035830 RepID=UPI003B7DCA11